MDELEINAQEQTETKQAFDGLFPYYCAKCGKEFYPTPMHRYKDGRRRRYCCWTCFNHRNDGRKTHWTPVECLYPSGELVKTFQSATKAAEWLGGNPSLIKEACMKDTEYKGYLWRFKV